MKILSLALAVLLAACHTPAEPRPANDSIPACTPDTPPDALCVSYPGDPPPPPHP